MRTNKGGGEMDFLAGFLFVALAIGLSGFFSCQEGYKEGAKAIQKQAVEGGHGRYDVDSDANATFVWSTDKCGVK